MAVIEVVKGGQKIENVVITTPQPMTPTGALPPDIGYVEIGTSEDRGSIWMTGEGPPTDPAGQAGDMYLDMDTGDIWQWNGTEWELQGTFAPSTDTPEEVLAKIITVDGPGSELDADTLDGHDSLYFATDADMNTAELAITSLDDRLDMTEAKNAQQDTDISMKADIASPTFTGDPRAPTPATNDNDTSIATTAYVKANIATIPPNDWASIPGKPATFPPTVPIAQADVTNLVSDLALKAPLASPTFTGDPKAPTPATSDNDTSIATTAFVKAVTGAIVGGALISDTPPASPAVGQMWFESDSGNTFIWYNDGDSAQWVQVNIQPAIATNPNAGQTAQTRNRVVNPNFCISQENGSAAGTTLGYYVADQWAHGGAPPGGYTFSSQRVQSYTPNGSLFRWRHTVTAGAAIGTGVVSLGTVIEGIRIGDFLWGGASARQVILRFGWKSPAGTYSIHLRNGATDRAYIAGFTVTAGQANTDTVQTFVIPGDTTGSWMGDTSVGMYLGVCLAAGGTYAGAAGWRAGNICGLTGQTNGLVTSAVYEWFDVSLQLDPLNTGLPAPWVAPDEAQELIACQRYWVAGDYSLNSYTTAGSYNAQIWQFAPTMRTAPAVTMNVLSSVNCTGAGGVQSQTPSSMEVYFSVSALGNAYMHCALKFSARM